MGSLNPTMAILSWAFVISISAFAAALIARIAVFLYREFTPAVTNWPWDSGVDTHRERIGANWRSAVVASIILQVGILISGIPNPVFLAGPLNIAAILLLNRATEILAPRLRLEVRTIASTALLLISLLVLFRTVAG